MTRRTAIEPGKTLVQAFTYDQQQLPTHKPVVQYIRQSQGSQVKHNRASSEMQDKSMRNNLLAQGWKPELILDAISEDTGKSGTKRADERKGLQRLIELIKTNKVGAIAAFNVSRIYRVISKAEYGAFCDLVLTHDIPVLPARRGDCPNTTDTST